MDLHEDRAVQTVLVVDIVGSTMMKERESEVSWLATHTSFFRLVIEQVQISGGKIVKSTGDGVFAIFGPRDATNAINAAIKIQEKIEVENRQNRLKLACSVGVAYGEMIRLTFPEGGYDYIGRTADRACRLCDAANANAIFADDEVIAAAQLHDVTSTFGCAANRSMRDYQGERQSISLKGITHPVEYYEIWWGKDKYGVNPAFVTESTGNPSPSKLSRDDKKTVGIGANPILTVKGSENGLNKWSKGIITSWGRVDAKGNKYGFIEGENGSEYWFNKDYLFLPNDTGEIEEGWKVIFLPASAYGGNKERATKIFIQEICHEAVFNNVNRGKKCCFADLLGQNNRQPEPHSLYILGAQDLQRGANIRVKIVGGNDRGPIGEIVVAENYKSSQTSLPERYSDWSSDRSASDCNGEEKDPKPRKTFWGVR
jgi:class 3 adenylate cyclase